MNKGFSLIEVIIYISLLAVLIIGVFSSTVGSIYSQMNRPSFTEADYQNLIKNYHEE